MALASRNHRTAALVAVVAVGVIFVLLVLAQLIGPGIAASTIRSRVDRYGSVRSVSVSAFPAIELGWGSVDSVRVRAGALHLEPQQAASLLWEGSGANRIDTSAESVQLSSLQLSHVAFRKRGSALFGEGEMSEAQVAAALPPGLHVSLLGSEGGEVRVRVSGGLFGVGASLDAVALASGGALVAHPIGPPFEGVRLTLFSNPHVYVEGVGASVRSTHPLSYRLTMTARLR